MLSQTIKPLPQIINKAQGNHRSSFPPKKDSDSDLSRRKNPLGEKLRDLAYVLDFLDLLQDFDHLIHSLSANRDGRKRAQLRNFSKNSSRLMGLRGCPLK